MSVRVCACMFTNVCVHIFVCVVRTYVSVSSVSERVCETVLVQSSSSFHLCSKKREIKFTEEKEPCLKTKL